MKGLFFLVFFLFLISGCAKENAHPLEVVDYSYKITVTSHYQHRAVIERTNQPYYIVAATKTLTDVVKSNAEYSIKVSAQSPFRILLERDGKILTDQSTTLFTFEQ